MLILVRQKTMDTIRDRFLARAGLNNPSVKDIINAIKAIPHGRPRERSAHGVVHDWRGTCSTKLLLLREICPDLPMQQRRWRKVNSPELVALVRAGVKFENGKMIESGEVAA